MTSSPIKQYSYRMFVALPFTFLFAPIFYPLFGYQPNPAFGFYIYFWYALFIYLGMTVAFILKKYKYLAYPVIIVFAFLARSAAALPALDLQTVYMFEGEFGETYYINIPVTADELAYIMLILFITSAIAGCFSAAYTKKPAVDFMQRGNTFLFLHLAVFGGLWHGSVVYTGLFAASYFIVRNFILISRELEVYGEKGAYNTSGIRRIVAYYFCMTVLLTIFPLIISIITVPFIVRHISALIGAALLAVGRHIADYERILPVLAEAGLPEGGGSGAMPEFDGGRQLNYVLVYNIMLAAALLILFMFRKAIWGQLKLLFDKENRPEHEKNMVINQEVTAELPKKKKGRAAYKNYLKKSRRITDTGKRFLFAYNCLFWELVRSSKLRESLTPQELAAIAEREGGVFDAHGKPDDKYGAFSDITGLYEDIKYGHILRSDGFIKEMTVKTEVLLKRALK